MQSFYPERFERDMGCTEAEWLRWLPAALGTRPWQQQPPGGVQVDLAVGRLALTWQVAAPRRLGLVRIPRLLVQFAFDGTDPTERYAFMQRFDLYMQRGGG